MPDAKPTSRRDALNLRIRPQDRGLIDRAAQLTGKSRTDGATGRFVAAQGRRVVAYYTKRRRQ